MANVLRGGRALLVLPALFLAVAMPGLAHAGPCTCQDVPAMKYRIKEARAMLQAYQAEIASIGQGPRYSWSAYRRFEDGPLQTMLNTLKASTPNSPQTWRGGTDPASCRSHFPEAATACLREALRRHEGHHAAVCGTRKGLLGGTTSPLTDYRDGNSLAAAYEEEIAAWRLEMDFLQSQIDALPDSCKPPGWILTFEVQVRGSGGRVSHAAGDTPAQHTWKLDHTYSGTVKLDRRTLSHRASHAVQLTPAQLQSLTVQQAMALKQTVSQGKSWDPTQRPVQVDVAIDDQDVRFVHEPGEGPAWEESTTTRKWKGTGTDELRGGVTFEEDTGAATYNVDISIQPAGRSGTVTYDESEEFNRTPSGYGRAPTHEVRPKRPQSLPLATMKIPDVRGLLTGGRIHHAQDRALELAGGMLQFDSGWVAPDPLAQPFAGLPEAAQKLKVRVYYRLSKPE